MITGLCNLGYYSILMTVTVFDSKVHFEMPFFLAENGVGRGTIAATNPGHAIQFSLKPLKAADTFNHQFSLQQLSVNLAFKSCRCSPRN